MISVELTEEELHKIEILRNVLIGNTITFRLNDCKDFPLKKCVVIKNQPNLDQSDNIETKNVYYFSDVTKIDVSLDVSMQQCLFSISCRFEHSELENINDHIKFSDLKIEPEYTNAIAIKVRSVGETALDTI